METISTIIEQLTLDQKAALTTGINNWETLALHEYDVASVKMSDGPHGLRLEAYDENGNRYTKTSVSFPALATLAASFDRHLLEKVGKTLGELCQAESVDV